MVQPHMAQRHRKAIPTAAYDRNMVQPHMAQRHSKAIPTAAYYRRMVQSHIAHRHTVLPYGTAECYRHVLQPNMA